MESIWKQFSCKFTIIGINTRLLFTDTDTDSLYDELHEKIHTKKCTSTKNYLIYVMFLQVVNITAAIIKKVVGKMKDEYGGK